MSLSADLDTWAAGVATAMGMAVTRDPDLILPPCLFVGMPDITAATLTGVQLQVPVWLIPDGAGKPAGDQRLDNVLKVIARDDFADTATDTTLTIAGVDFPAYALTARLYVTP